MSAAAIHARWQHYVLVKEDHFRSFWLARLAEPGRTVLFILGRGFDPRMCLALKLMLEATGSWLRDVIALDYREGPTSPSLTHQDRVDANWADLQSAIQGRSNLSLRPLEFWSPEGRRATSRNARDLLGSAEELTNYSDIIVDISAMPRSVYFPLVARILHFLDSQSSSPSPPVNLHVVVAEDPGLDAGIKEEGVDLNAEFIGSFVGGFDEEAIQTPKVWIPLLGEHRTTQFDRIRDLVKPDEICPVLPSPARNPRRADDIVIEYQRLLFDELLLDPREFIYASEHNPFEVYRQLRTAVLHYSEVFRLLGGCKVALSALSSKLMSLGALLVAYELKQVGYSVGVAHVECQGYTMETTASNASLVGLWLAGECYGA